jgi:hypothetical protein
MEELNPIDELLAEDEKKHQTEIPYQNFGTAVGDEFGSCDKDIFAFGTLVRVSPLDKESTQEIVVALQALGWNLDWHWESSRLVVKALEPNERMDTLRALFEEKCRNRAEVIRKETSKMTAKFDKRHTPC